MLQTRRDLKCSGTASKYYPFVVPRCSYARLTGRGAIHTQAAPTMLCPNPGCSTPAVTSKFCKRCHHTWAPCARCHTAKHPRGTEKVPRSLGVGLRRGPVNLESVREV